MEKILLVGDDVHLVATRAAVLATKNIEVVSSSARELAAQPEDGEFDLVVLCHSLREDNLPAVMTNIRQRWPGVRILRIFKLFADMPAAEYGVNAVSTPEPGVVIEHVMKLLGRSHRALKSAGPTTAPDELRSARV